MKHEKWENATGTAILIVVGFCAGTVSFSHVIAWTILYGQPAMVGLVNALVTELLQIAAGLEIKRRRRTGRSGWRAFWFPSAVLGLACGMSLIAQLSQASPSWQGRLVATLPMIGFLFTVKIVMGRSPATVPATEAAAPPHLVVETVPDESADQPPVPVPVSSPLVTAAPIDEPSPVLVPAGEQTTLDLVPQSPSGRPASSGGFPADTVPPSRAAGTVPAEASPSPSPRPSPSGRPALSGEFEPDVLAAADEILRELAAEGGRITRDRFAAKLRDRDMGMSNGRAGALLNWRRELIPA